MSSAEARHEELLYRPTLLNRPSRVDVEAEGHEPRPAPSLLELHHEALRGRYAVVVGLPRVAQLDPELGR